MRDFPKYPAHSWPERRNAAVRALSVSREYTQAIFRGLEWLTVGELKDTKPTDGKLTAAVFKKQEQLANVWSLVDVRDLPAVASHLAPQMKPRRFSYVTDGQDLARAYGQLAAVRLRAAQWRQVEVPTPRDQLVQKVFDDYLYDRIQLGVAAVRRPKEIEAFNDVFSKSFAKARGTSLDGFPPATPYRTPWLSATQDLRGSDFGVSLVATAASNVVDRFRR